MSHITLDCIGLPCPQPVLRVKDALEQGARQLEVLVDNEASKNNVLRFAQHQGHTAASTDRPEGCFAILVTAAETPVPQADDPDLYRCAPPAATRLVYVISSDSMGRGSEELGWALLQTYIQTIKEIKPLPDKILFYNSGVKLVTAASGALEALKQLQDQGVEILACGTCLDFFQLKSAMRVGQISNMYTIMDAMASADKLVSPF
ncbi:MAG: sulfurtransferase-like selenium metabolism protein YedF [Desulfobulbus sp.]|uniref:sulfurtransferase-like selenium metabolism protein YedF n=1 Tax=Desulfobulbus sp. TaxID=895 RepID=UPI00284B4D5B|nr:sulfurtransferase-like selenium metabolism protein YedF [Desulfobulbus sp.]MDR2549497.1 sulfurtransferase-like selenium metabolism protein YedF [Desulfobulbus sp.]